MVQKSCDSLGKPQRTNNENCSVCKELLTHIRRFLNMSETTGRSNHSDWLTVNEIASELKISKTVVYRLIRHGELEAVNIVDSNGKIPQKGHYRIKRSSLNQYLEAKKVRQFPNGVAHESRSRRFPGVKNRLGL
jgi:excisionase family DNA binding protein